jgi:hypothetical protein
MSANAFRSIWSLCALFTFADAALGFLRVAGVHTGGEGTAVEALGIFKYAPSEVPGVALPVQIALFGALLLLTRVWTRQLGADKWATRFPVFYFAAADVDPATDGGARYQFCAFVVFLVVPLLLLVIMMMSYLRGTIYFSQEHTSDVISTNVSGWGHFNALRIYRAAQGKVGSFRLGTAEGPEYFPLLTWLYALLIVSEVSYFFCVVLRGLFGRLVSHKTPWVTRAGY